MGINFNKVANRVFQTLKGYGYSLQMFDEQGKKVFNPEEGRFFYANPDQIMVTLHDEGEYSVLKMYLSKQADVEQLQKLINNLRETATRYNLSWNIRTFGKQITPKDFAFMLKGNVSESTEQFSFLRDISQKR